MFAGFSPHELTLVFGPPLSTTRCFTQRDDGLFLFKLRQDDPLHGYAYLRDDWWNYVSLGVRELDVRFTVLLNEKAAILTDASDAFAAANQRVRLGDFECRLVAYREWKRADAPQRCYVRLRGSGPSTGAESAAESGQ